MYYAPRRRKCVKGRSFYTERSNIFSTEKENSALVCQNEQSYINVIESDNGEEETITIDLAAFLAEHPLITDTAFENFPENDVTATESSSQFHFTDSKIDPSEVDKTEIYCVSGDISENCCNMSKKEEKLNLVYGDAPLGTSLYNYILNNTIFNDFDINDFEDNISIEIFSNSNGNTTDSVSEKDSFPYSSLREAKGKQMETFQNEENSLKNFTSVSDCNMEFEKYEDLIQKEQLPSNSQDECENGNSLKIDIFNKRRKIHSFNDNNSKFIESAVVKTQKHYSSKCVSEVKSVIPKEMIESKSDYQNGIGHHERKSNHRINNWCNYSRNEQHDGASDNKKPKGNNRYKHENDQHNSSCFNPSPKRMKEDSNTESYKKSQYHSGENCRKPDFNQLSLKKKYCKNHSRSSSRSDSDQVDDNLTGSQFPKLNELSLWKNCKFSEDLVKKNKQDRVKTWIESVNKSKKYLEENTSSKKVKNDIKPYSKFDNGERLFNDADKWSSAEQSISWQMIDENKINKTNVSKEADNHQNVSSKSADKINSEKDKKCVVLLTPAVVIRLKRITSYEKELLKSTDEKEFMKSADEEEYDFFGFTEEDVITAERKTAESKRQAAVLQNCFLNISNSTR